jgi:hypothetical protein
VEKLVPSLLVNGYCSDWMRCELFLDFVMICLIRSDCGSKICGCED